MRITFLLLGLFTFSCISCNQNTAKEKNLLGNWQAFEVLEEGETLSVNPEEIKFTFKENHSYSFSSTLNYKEAGSFHLDFPYLYTTDTVNQATTEKAVEIIQLVTDSLTLKMKEKGRKRIIKLVKVGS